MGAECGKTDLGVSGVGWHENQPLCQCLEEADKEEGVLHCLLWSEMGTADDVLGGCGWCWDGGSAHDLSRLVMGVVAVMCECGAGCGVLWYDVVGW